MYKMNLYLKIIITFLALLVIIISNNYITLWFLLLVFTYINLFNKKYKLLSLSFILIFLLAVANRLEDYLIVYKVAFIFSILISFMNYLNSKDKKYIKYCFDNNRNKTLREDFNNEYFDKIYQYNKNMVNDKYGDVSFDNKIENDLERKYLQSRIRFNGYGLNNSNNKIEWNRIDVLLLIFSILVFCIMIIIR